MSQQTNKQAETLLVEIDYEPVDSHNATRPFCSDRECVCHGNSELLQQEIYQPLQEGLMTQDEALRLYRGQMI